MNVPKNWLRPASRLGAKAPLFLIVFMGVAVGALAWASLWILETRNGESARLHPATSLRTLAVLTHASDPG